MLPAFWLGGCADTLPEGKPIAELVRGYDRTLNSTQRQAVITELQQDKERQQTQIGQDQAAEKPTENQR
jgi:hypothetical protein